MSHDITRYDSKVALITELVTARRVLHLGAIGETMNSTAEKVRLMPLSLHAAITAKARQCVGVDYDSDAVEAIHQARAADNLIAADVYLLKRAQIQMDEIDVVVAGDIVEHLSNPGRMLDVLTGLCDPDTKLVLTVPNSQGLPQFIRYLRGRPIEGADHKCSFNIYTLGNLLTEHGWRIATAATCYQPRAAADSGGLTFRAGLRLLRRFPHLGGTLLVEAERITS